MNTYSLSARIRARRWRQRAFTLYETLVTLSIAGVLSTAGIGIHGLFARHAMSVHVNRLIAHLHLARSEAIKRRVSVVLCKSGDGQSCTPDSLWQEGWIVFADINGNRQFDDGETLIWTQQALEGNVSLRYGETGKYHRVIYYPTGRGVPNATFTFCAGKDPAKAKAIILYWTGRPRSSARNSRGGPLQCG